MAWLFWDRLVFKGLVWGRTFIKIAISLIEAEIYMLKQELLIYCRENKVSLNPEITLLLENKKYEINSNGKIKERLLQVRLKNDIKFVFDQITTLKNHRLCRGYDDPDWSKVNITVAVRNRLTHPKSIECMLVSKQEVSDCKLAFNWCIHNLVYFLEQDKSDIELKYAKKIEDLEMRERILNQGTEST